ncbi:MAG: fructokinase [Chloroflexi bacterium]|nr:fructokinase [Chloroflexota bacterium]
MSIVCFGELLIDFVALEHGVTVGEASGFIKAPGGAPANVAVAVQRLGHPAAFMGQVGDDPFGHYLVGVLESNGVDVSGMTFAPEARTALAFVSLRLDGERSFMFYRHPSADMLLRPQDLKLDVMAGKRIFHFGSISMIGEPSRSATLKAVQHAVAQGMFVSYDPNLRLALWPDADAARAGMKIGLEYARFVKVSEEELEFLTGGNDAAALWCGAMQVLVVSRGAQGASIYTRTAHYDVPSFNVSAVDTTGAGDAFVAAMLVGILENADYEQKLPEIARFANAVGALTTTQKGAIPSLPTRGAAEAFMKAMS